MKKILLFLIVIFCSSSALAQFSIDAYKEYLNSHKDMTVEQLLNEYPAGLFKKTAPTNFERALYSDSIDIKYNLTEYEKELIRKHGFMVTERQSFNNFHEAFEDIFYNDLPVYISSDAILHALHWTYYKLFEELEEMYLSEELFDVLKIMHDYLPELEKQSTESLYQTTLRDFDIYLTISKKLLCGGYNSCNPKDTIPYFKENVPICNEIITLIKKEKPEKISLFSTTPRIFDFSQFTARGYYADDYNMTKYFKAMTWLGKIEILIDKPKQDLNPNEQQQTDEDIHRQNLLAAMITEAAIQTGTYNSPENIENVLSAFIGKQDNLSFGDVDSVMKKLDIINAAEIINDEKYKLFQSELLKLNSSKQLYNSQILCSNILDTEQIEPPAAFLLFGQRPILDGYITANVVYDRILYQGKKVPRMLPSTLDILFALGNDASIQLLNDELQKYPYATNLAALRYLVTSYDTTFWKSNCYTNWLSAIKALNPPNNRDNLPPFMQTAAWWQKSMNTQLASWSQLRHDFILYAKQPLSSSNACSYPYSYVEPFPDFYRAISSFAESMINTFNSIYFDEIRYDHYVLPVLEKFVLVGNQLAIISEKELKNEALTEDEITFLKSMLRNAKYNCVLYLDGWYPNLFYRLFYKERQGFEEEKQCNYTVADVHTAPTDADGNEVGWVLHGGTGKINTAVIVAKNHEGKDCAFIGPVMSYYECVTSNYQRLTDEEWETFHSSPQAYRPNFTNLYLAGKQGEELGEKTMLFTDVEEAPVEISNNLQLLSFPNPFSTTTTIVFTVPPSQSNKNVELNIFDMQGRLVKQLINEPIPAGNYSSRWDGTDSFGNKVEAGVYLFVVKAGVVQNAGKASLIGN